MEHHIVLTKQTTIRVHLLRSDKAHRCSQCGLRRILIAVTLYPAGLSPEIWMCAECSGLRVPVVSVALDRHSGDIVGGLWDALDEATALPTDHPLLMEARASVALDHDPDEGTHSVGDGHDHEVTA